MRSGRRLPRALRRCLAVAALSVLAAALATHPEAAAAATAPEARGGQPLVKALTVARGDTLAGLLAAAGVARRDAEGAIATLKRHFDPRKLSVGRRLVVVLDGREAPARLVAVNLETSANRFLVVRRDGRRFVAERARAPFVPRLDEAPAEGRSTVRMRRGDTLLDALSRAGARWDEARAVSAALGRHVDLRRLAVGQRLEIVFRPGAGRRTLAAVSLALSDKSYIVSGRGGDGGFSAWRADAPLRPAATPPPEAPQETAKPIDDGRQTLRIRKGDTLTHALMTAGGERREAYAAAAALSRHFDPRRLQVGQELIVVFDPGSQRRRPALAAVSLALGDGSFVVAGRGDGGRFGANLASEPLIPVFNGEGAGTAPVTPSGATEGKSLRIRKGDTLMLTLLRAGGSWRETNAAIAALSRHFDPRRLKVGQELSMVFDTVNGAPKPGLAAVSLALDDTSYIVAARGDDGGFAAWRSSEPLAAQFNDAFFPEASVPPAPEIVLAALSGDAERKSLEVRRGDTLMKALLRAGSDPRDADAAIRALKAVYDPRRLRAGQRLTVDLVPDGAGGRAALQRLSLRTEPGRNVEVGRAEDGGFAARAVEVPLERVLVRAGGRIESSLYQAATKAGVPVPVLMDMIRAFSFDVDFQREIQRGDDFEVLFEHFLDESGTAVREGSVLYARLTLSGVALNIYRHATRSGLADFYDEKGQSVRKALLRTPIDGARLTSGYGRRRHPILGYTRMHRGVDFAAPRGAAVVAAGDGVVERIGWNGPYGRYIRIRHRGLYSTAYAHLSGYAKGMQRGRRVKQGQVIARVGSTGLSTGPHLHYEVLRNGRQINPLKVKLPAGARLKGAELAAFDAARRDIDRQLAAIPLVRHVADAANGGPPAACGEASGSDQSGC